MKPTLVIGAGPNPARYAYMAVTLLRSHGHEVIAFGKEAGKIDDVTIEKEWNPDWNVDTVTLYINPTHQPPLIPKILALKPKRVIFNPGTENAVFENELRANGIEAEEACTLVLLHSGQY